MTFGEPIKPCLDCVAGRCTMNCSTPMKEGSIFPARDPWAELVKIAREINPDLPADLSGYEVRIILNKDFQAVELMAADMVKLGQGS
jgi:hypothetical protein